MTLEERLSYLEEEIKSIKEEINKTYTWTPKQGEKYYFISDLGNVGVSNNLDAKTLNARCCINNVFKCDENMTKKLLNYIKNVYAVQNKLFQLHEEFCPEHKLDYDSYNTSGECRVYRHKNACGNIRWEGEYISISDNRSYNEVYFPNLDIAQKVCDILNLEHFMLEK